MANRISRRTVADYVARQLLAGEEHVIAQLAAHLVQTGHTKQLDLYVYDIEAALAAHGTVVADVASARKLTDKAVHAIAAHIKQAHEATNVELRQTVDPQLVGGVKIQTPGAEYDATIRRRLTKLHRMKV